MSIIHPFRLRYSNAYLVVGARPILVDTGSRGDAASIRAGCAAAGVNIRDLALILHTPGHTPGSITVVLDSGDAIVGDVLMGGYAGGAISPTKPNFHYFADDLPAAMASIDRILAAASGRLFVGHGGPLRHDDVCTWRQAAGSARRTFQHLGR